MQIPYLQEFFDTHWYFVRDCTFELHAIYDATFVEIPYHDQLQPFNLVALETDLQEHLDNRVNQIIAKTEWVTKFTDSYTKWVATAEISTPLHCSMLLLNDRHPVHLNFITSLDFLGTIYRAYEDLVTTNHSQPWLGYIANCDVIIGKVRKGFKRFETFVISGNYFRSISGLPPCTVSRKST